MLKRTIQYVFIIALLCSCGSVSNPTEPDSTFTVYAKIKDVYQKRSIQSPNSHVNSKLAKVNQDGVLSCSFKSNSKTDFYLTVFPYKPVKLPVNSFQHKSNPGTVYLRFPSKLEQYYRMLVRAKSLGYHITSVENWHRNQSKYSTGKLFIMRHDVDFDTRMAKAFAYVEKLLDVTSTYYWRWSTVSKEPIEYVKNYGHEVGLHYETLATFCWDNNIYGKKDVTVDVIKKCQDILKSEIKIFEEFYGDIYSISSHGDGRNRLLDIPNRVLLDDEDLADYSIVVCGTQLELTRRSVQTFVADSGGKWYPFGADYALDLAPQNIYCLIHPVWWKQHH
jgi:hypothetical protein